jgi:membrane-associated protease RseP (regulator of RpoE activity)
LNLDFAGTSILLDVVIGLLKPLNANETLLMHPILFAAWIGMLITGINLLPVGQLDGGHIAYALIGRHAYILALIFFGGLIAAGFILSPNWLVWAFFVMFGGLRHPPPSNDITGLDWPRRLLGLGSIVLFIIVVIPAPFGS